jgi:ribosomal protein S18 acetylase RimI-like enzyme
MNFASTRLWELPWDQVLPLRLTSGGADLVPISYEEISRFVTEHFEEVYDEPDSPFLWLAPHEARARYYASFGDLFGFRQDGRIVGIAACAPSDWSTYYIRNVSFLPDIEGQGISQAFLKNLIQILPRHGVERLELETAPSNFGVIQIVTRLGFNVTGQSNTERWGSLLRFTRFLDSNFERVFLDRFCCGRKPQLKRLSGSVADDNKSGRRSYEEEVRSNQRLTTPDERG